MVQSFSKYKFLWNNAVNRLSLKTDPWTSTFLSLFFLRQNLSNYNWSIFSKKPLTIATCPFFLRKPLKIARSIFSRETSYRSCENITPKCFRFFFTGFSFNLTQWMYCMLGNVKWKIFDFFVEKNGFSKESFTWVFSKVMSHNEQIKHPGSTECNSCIEWNWMKFSEKSFSQGFHGKHFGGYILATRVRTISEGFFLV